MVAARLLVGGAGEDDVSPEARHGLARGIAAGGAGLLGQPEHDLQLHGHHGLHVHGAPAVDVAVGDLGPEGVARPALGWRGHDVEVAEQEQWSTARPVGAKARDDVAATREGLQHAWLEAGRGQDVGQVARGEDLVAGRVDGGQADERPEVSDELVEGALGVPHSACLTRWRPSSPRVARRRG